MSDDQRYYPGSRHRLPAVAAPAERAEPTWDANPVMKVIHGVEMELFTVGALGVALGRSAVTMRVWERNGLLPKAKFRLANRNGIGGRRYYSRAQVEATVAVARDLQMTGEQQQRRIHPDFTGRVLQAWRDLEKGERASA